MAGPAEVYVAGLRDTLRAVRQAGDDVQKDVRRAFQAEVAPTVADIKGRFSSLGRTGPRTARTVRGSVSQQRIELRMGGRGGAAWGFELGTEFGAKDRLRVSTFTRGGSTVTRRQNYSKNFGQWTGNRFEPQGQVAGHAFYPGIRDNYDDLVDGVVRAVDGALDKVGRTGA